MHSVMMLAGGAGLLLAFALGGAISGGRAGVARAAVAFLPAWLLVALGNMYVGVVHAGYSVAAEAPILLGIFGLPAAAAWAVRHWARSG